MKPKTGHKRESRKKVISVKARKGGQLGQSKANCRQSSSENEHFGFSQSDASNQFTDFTPTRLSNHPGDMSFPYLSGNNSTNFEMFRPGPSAPSSFYPAATATNPQVPAFSLQSPFTCTPFCGSSFWRPDELQTLENVSRKLDRLLIDSRNSSSESPPTHDYKFPNPNFSPSRATNELPHHQPPPPPVNRPLPPLGVFWDIENCSVPKGKSALVTVQHIRDRFLTGYMEYEFLCVCDIRKESPQIIQELNDAQVSVVHVSGNSKNAADDKLRQAMRRYADVCTLLVPGFNQERPAIVLVSGDINFSPTISDLRYRKGLYVILLHNAHAPEALTVCAHEHYNFHTVLEDLPTRTVPLRKTFIEDRKDIPLKGGHCPMDVLVTDLPNIKNLAKLKNRLKKLSDNCGGKVVTVQGQFAVLRFPNKEAALRASKRMNGEDVFGSKIKVIYSSQMEFRTQSCSRLETRSLETHSSVAFEPVKTRTLSSFQYKPPMDPTLINPNCSATSTRKTRWSDPNEPNLSENEHNLYQPSSLLAQPSHSSTSNSHTASSSYSSSGESSPVYNQLGLGIGGSQISMSMGVDTTTLKKEIASLLRGVPNFTLPLFKFREMFANRYRRSITSSDLYKLGDVVIISGGFPRNKASPASSNGRTITLRSEWQIDDEEIIDIYCPAHPPQMRGSSSHLGWAEKEIGALLPNVIVELASFSRNLLSLIESHGGGFPLLSFLDCYESEFPPLQKVLDPQGVPLEHIISCIPGVEICTGENGMKRAQLVKGPVSSTIIQPMGPQLMQLSKELVDLLKTFPKCSVPFAKLIPAYHHHFGKQCKVSDYGHYSLFSLLQNMASTVQVLGDTNNRVITLCHRAQMKRFATDVLRVLKSANGTKKQVELEEFPNAYEQLFSKPFAPEDYGLCFLSDLVKELIENSCLVALTKDESSKLYLSIPRREQTAAELQNMRAFALEVVELLRHSVRCEIPFSRFIPSYHHHFGSQCRVSNFGFSKLVELLEAIPEIVEIVEPNKESGHVERFVRLTTKEQLKVIGTQIWNLVHKRDEAGIQTYLYELEELFANEHGYSLRTELCGANGIRDLCSKLSQYLQVERDEIKLADKIPTGNADEGLTGHVSHPPGFRHHHSSRPYGFKNKSRLQLKHSASAPGSPNNLSYIAQWDHRQRIHLPPLTILSPSLSSPSFSPVPDDMNIFSFDGIVQAPMSPPFYDTLGRDVSSPCLSPQFVWTYPVPYYPPPTPPSVMIPAFPFNGPWANSSPPSMLSGPCFEQFPQN